MVAVLLLKSTAPGEPDKYSEALKADGHECHVINTLTFEYHLNSLLDVRVDQYQGIIFTSPRAVEAFRRVPLGDGATRLRCFTVGPATADAARVMGFAPEGMDSGNAECLADYILTALAPGPAVPSRLLFPCAAERSGAIERRLLDAHVAVDVRIVYSSVKAPQLDAELRSHLENNTVDIIAFFSPSAVHHSNEVVREFSRRTFSVLCPL